MPPATRFVALAAVALGALAPVADAGPCLTCDPGTGPFTLGWRDDRAIAASGDDAHAPRIDADSAGGSTWIGVVWEDRRGGDGDIVLATSADGGCTWQRRELTTGPEDDRLPDVSLSTWHDALTVVFARDGRIYATTSTDRAATFPTPLGVNPIAPADPAAAPRVAGVPIDGVVHRHVVWAAGGELWHAHGTVVAPALWASGTPLSASITGLAEWGSPDVAADSSSSDPATRSAVSIVATARRSGASARELFSLRSNADGAPFFGDPTDPATLWVPRAVSDPRADDPALSVSMPHLDGSDDGSGVFYPWNVAAWAEARAGAPRCTVDARAEEGTGPSVIADWNEPPASADVPLGTPPSPPAGVSVLPNPLGRPPTPELHLFVEATVAGAREVSAIRGTLDARATPSVTTWCGPDPITGVAPPRPGGAVTAGSFAVDEDLSHLYAVWADDRDGGSTIYFKRTDSSTSPPTALVATPAACAPGSALEIAWNAPADPPHCDVDHYRVDYGLASGVYDWSVEVRAGTRTVLGGLDDLTTYYILVTTVDEACHERAQFEISAVAPNCTGFPPCPKGVGNTLRAGKSGLDVALSWEPPPVDTFHGPARSYDVYRSTDDKAAGYAREASVGAPRYDDPGAVSPSPSTRHFYVVVAVNDCGTSNDEPPP